MNLEDTLVGIARYDMNAIYKERDALIKKLDIDKKKIYLLKTTQLQTIFLDYLDVSAGTQKMKNQLEENKEKYLKLFCKVDKKQHMIKSFGKIENIDIDTIVDLYRVVKIVKIIQMVNNLAFECASIVNTKKFFERNGIY